MTSPTQSLFCLTALCTLMALPSHGEGLATSSASSAASSASNSIGSASESFERSSKGSSRATKIAQGDYLLIAVAVAADQPDRVRLTLRAVGTSEDENDMILNLPQLAFASSALAKGQLITARQRSYGVEFAHGLTQQAFFLVLNDDSHRELSANAVTL